MKITYPISLQEIAAWARSNETSVAVAEFRFAQYGVLQAVAGSRTLSHTLAFKGGNALDFIWLPNRSTRDLDFSSLDSKLTAESLRNSLGPSLELVSRTTGVLYRVQKMEQQPPGPNRSFITLEGKIGYALPDDRRNVQLFREGKASKAVVPMEVSLNDPICLTAPIEVASSNPLQVCQLEDIVAEKPRALLQQPIRNRYRPQDVLDICVVTRMNPDLDLNLVAQFLLEKAAARNVPVSRAAFYHEEVRRRAFEGYDGLRGTTRYSFVGFEDAFGEVLSLVDRLPLLQGGESSIS